MTTYSTVDVTPDTPEWLTERRNSVGASEVAAVMGLSPWATPLDIWKSKQGIDKDFDPILAFVGHESEAIIRKWVSDHSGLGVELVRGCMARRDDRPHLHASFDDLTANGEPVQYKTAHQRTEHKWDEGIPTDIRVQVQAEMYVADAPRALVVVWIGGREFRSFWEPRDDRFINEQMLPAVDAFWNLVQSHAAPDPSTVAEVAEVYPSQEREVELSDDAFEVFERIQVLRSDIKAQEDEAKALTVALAGYVEDADTLIHDGRKVATWRSQKGRSSFNARVFQSDYPELYAEYVTQGAPFRVLRATKGQK